MCLPSRNERQDRALRLLPFLPIEGSDWIENGGVEAVVHLDGRVRR